MRLLIIDDIVAIRIAMPCANTIVGSLFTKFVIVSDVRWISCGDIDLLFSSVGCDDRLLFL